MAISTRALKNLGLGIAGTGALAGAGIVGHNIGAKRMSNAMVNAFSEQNALENEALKRNMIARFARDNQEENSRLAEHFLRRGIAIGSQKGMTKKSSYDMLDKLAALI